MFDVKKYAVIMILVSAVGTCYGANAILENYRTIANEAKVVFNVISMRQNPLTGKTDQGVALYAEALDVYSKIVNLEIFVRELCKIFANKQAVFEAFDTYVDKALQIIIQAAEYKNRLKGIQKKLSEMLVVRLAAAQKLPSVESGVKRGWSFFKRSNNKANISPEIQSEKVEGVNVDLKANHFYGRVGDDRSKSMSAKMALGREFEECEESNDKVSKPIRGFLTTRAETSEYEHIDGDESKGKITHEGVRLRIPSNRASVDEHTFTIVPRLKKDQSHEKPAYAQLGADRKMYSKPIDIGIEPLYSQLGPAAVKDN